MKSAIVLTALLVLTGCASLVLGTSSTVGIGVAQERRLGRGVDDGLIAAQIGERWFRHDVRLPHLLDITVNEGRVLVTGVVPDVDLRVDAIRLAWQIDGVQEVINEIQISENRPAEAVAQDLWISTQIRTRMTLNTEVAAINYTVDTVNGVVYLFGIARSQPELERVQTLARQTKGVTRVISYVQIGSSDN